MKKINLKDLDLTIYNETLPNKLEVYYLPLYTNNRYHIQFISKYGSKNTYYEKNKKKIKIPDGTAHYLEHKMFENEDNSNTFEKFTKHGSYCNAFTSEDKTKYICSGSFYFKEDLNSLIDYVINPHFTEENVEKEKGIIEEEIKRCEDDVYRTLYNEKKKSIYNSKEYSNNIIGTIESISKINKDLLYDIYNYFYTPNNMILLVTGNFKLEEASKIINNKLKDIKNTHKEKKIEIKEKKEVKRKKTEKTFRTETDKVDISIKVDANDYDLSKVELDLYLELFLNIVFGNTSNLYQDILDKKLISTFDIGSDINDNYIILYLAANTINKEEYIKEIDNTFKNIKVEETDFNRIKKVIIANLVSMTDDAGIMINVISDDLFSYNEIITNKIDLVKNAKYSKLKQIIEKTDFSNRSITILKKK